MIRAIKRKIQKKKTKKAHTDANLDSIVRSLSYRADFNLVYDPEKMNERNGLSQAFFIVGPSSSTRLRTLLYCYPSNKFSFFNESFEGIVKFCFPNGSYSQSINQGRIMNQFVFGLNDNGSLSFGICTHVNLRDAPLRFMSSVNNDTAYCFCTITSIPMLQAHFSFHEYILNILAGHITEKLSVNEEDLSPPHQLYDELMQNPDSIEELRGKFKTFDPPLELFDENALIAKIGDNEIPPLFSDAIDFYFRIHVKKNKDFDFDLGHDYSLHISKRGDKLIDVAHYCFDIMFSRLSVNNVARFYRSLLLEEKIIVISSNLSLITFVVMAALPMMSPMSLKSSLMPILPNDGEFVDYIGTPVPYVMGILRTEFLSNIDIPEGTTVVKLDEDNIDYPDDIPHLPHAKKLKKSLQILRHKYYYETRGFLKKLGVHSFGYAGTRELIETFTTFLNQFVSNDRLAGCRVRDTTDEEHPVVGFVKEAYMTEVPEKCTDFFNMFVDTQTFNDYCESTFLNPEQHQ